MLYLIAAMAARTNGIGYQNTLPWRQSEDLKFFKRTTQGSAVIMGRKTFESLPKALPGRLNVVITRNVTDKVATKNVTYVSSLEAAIDVAKEYSDDAYVIGGSEIYALALPLVDVVYLTEVDVTDYRAKYDAYFPTKDLQGWVIDDVVNSGKSDETNQWPWRILKLVRSEDPDTTGLSDNRYYRMGRQLMGAYKRTTPIKGLERLGGLNVPRDSIYLCLRKTTFEFPHNSRTFSPYYLAHFLPNKRTLAGPLRDAFELKIQIEDAALKTKVVDRFYFALEQALKLNGCSIV